MSADAIIAGQFIPAKTNHKVNYVLRLLLPRASKFKGEVRL